MHRDHVPALPPNFELLGSTPACQVQGMVLPYPGGSSSNIADIHILCLQGHPEFVSDIVGKLIDARERSGVLSPEAVKDARQRYDKKHDGVDVVGKVIWEMVGVAAT